MGSQLFNQLSHYDLFTTPWTTSQLYLLFYLSIY